LKKNIARVKKAREESQRQADKLAAELAQAQAAAAKTAADIEAKEAQIAKNRASVDKLNEQISKAAEKRDAAADKRKVAWKRQAELESELGQIKETVDRAQRSMQMTMDRELHRGLESVRAIAADLGLEGRVFGPLIELFMCKPEFHQAVEITGGNSLFGVVVDTDATAAQVIAELNKRKGGRVTFVPLNRINPARPEYPVGVDAMPMIRQLKYDPKFEKAFLQTFGQSTRTLLRLRLLCFSYTGCSLFFLLVGECFAEQARR
jgi:structural maintenance of chromosome 3 (chondroitin sulfate proteoglycan 6)